MQVGICCVTGLYPLIPAQQVHGLCSLKPKPGKWEPYYCRCGCHKGTREREMQWQREAELRRRYHPNILNMGRWRHKRK